MANKKVHEFSADPDGWRKRLELAAEWSKKVLGSKLAQDSRVTSLGMEMGMLFEYDPRKGSKFVGMNLKDVPESEDLTTVLMWARPFVLKREPIYWEHVIEAMRGLAVESAVAIQVEQVARIWSRQPLKRVVYMKTTESGEHILPEGGVDGGYVAERLLYSQFAHADDASDILDHVDGHAQMWNLAGMAADWIATLSYQEQVIQLVAPDVVPELATWAGTPRTIFDRMGVKFGAGDAGGNEEAAPAGQ